MNIKKSMVIVLAVAVLMSGILALTACTAKKDDAQTTANTAAESTTTATDSTTKSTETTKEAENSSADIVGTWEYKDGGGFVYTFNSDGTGKYDAAGSVMEFTYTTDGNKLSILYKGNTASFDTEYSIDGDILNVKDSTDSDTLYKRVK